MTLEAECAAEFAVRAETHNGNVLTLRRHFKTMDDAESHPIIGAKWKRVWVEEMLRPKVEKVTKPEPKSDDLPPLPWRVQWVKGFTYLVDADGKKIASLLGAHAKRDKVGAAICGKGK